MLNVLLCNDSVLMGWKQFMESWVVKSWDVSSVLHKNSIFLGSIITEFYSSSASWGQEMIPQKYIFKNLL